MTTRAEFENQIIWVDNSKYVTTMVNDDQLENKLEEFLDDNEMQDLYAYADKYNTYVIGVKVDDTTIQVHFDNGYFCGWIL